MSPHIHSAAPAAAWVLIALLLTNGCATNETFSKAPRMGPDDYPNARWPDAVTTAPVESKRPIAQDVEFLRADAPELERAMREFTETGEAPLIKRRNVGTVTFPHGRAYPILYCKALRVCQVELQPGEKVINVAMGDNERWESFPMESGPAGLRTQHVIFTPQDADYRFSTNAIITTDRRVYHLGLIARPDLPERAASYNRHARFYYPDETVETWMSAQARKAEERAAVEAAQLAATRAQETVPRDLYHGYEVTGDIVPWKPEDVFDDGQQVYIKMPVASAVTESPGLWVIDEFGGQNLVNYRVREGHFIVDKVFSKARMAVGVGRQANEVFITRTKPTDGELVSAPDETHSSFAEKR